MESSVSTRKISRTVGTHRHVGSGKRRQHLLPGIPDDITLESICTKLPWRAFKILSLVSPAWQKAIESRQVYNARVRACSTETLVVHCHGCDTRIALFSGRDECCYELPPIPHLGEQFPLSGECVELDGKIYVLGGERWPGSVTGSREVFVLDVAGCREWKQCASMKEPRLGFGCSVSGGKIYAFGGRSDRLAVNRSEVYDPELNAWSPIMPMPSFRCDHRVATVGEELFAYAGECFYPDVFFVWSDGRPEDNGILPNLKDSTSNLEVYHPMKNEWRVVKDSQLNTCDPVFLVKGELHAMSDFGVHVYDIDKDSWTARHTISFPEHDLYDDIEPQAALAVDNDLFATVSNFRNKGNQIVSLFRSRGFDGGKEKIVWHKTSCHRASAYFTVLRPIKL